MQGLSIFLLIFCHVLTLSVSDDTIENEEQSSVDTNSNLNHRKPLFPKKNMKFFVSPEPVNYIRNHQKNVKNVRNKITLMPHFTPKYTVEVTIATTKKPKRKPLMKLRTFTMKSHIGETLHSVKRDMIKKAGKVEVQASTVSAMEPVTKAYEKSDFKMHSSTEATTIIIDKKNENFIAEEDRNEFIFVDGNNGNEQENNDDIETTTNYDYTTVSRKKIRSKRNDNIIIEENMSSTISPLKKYTGRDTRLNNNFYFKNINS